MSDDQNLPQTEPIQIGEPHHSEHWVHEAIAEQEEYLQRQRSCSPARWPGGFIEHKYVTFGVGSADLTIEDANTYSGCTECGVTETRADYAIRTAARDKAAGE